MNDNRKLIKLFFIGAFLVLSIIFWFLADGLIQDKQPIKQIDTPAKVVKNKKEMWTVNFGSASEVKKGQFDYEEVEKKIQSFLNFYQLETNSFNLEKITNQSTGVFLTNEDSGFQFIVDSIGGIVGFISANEIPDVSRTKLKEAFSSINLTDTKTLYIGALTNGLIYRDAQVPLINIDNLEEVKMEADVEIQPMRETWGDLKRIIEQRELKFNRFVKSPSGIQLAEYSLSGTEKVYYSLYLSHDESNKEMILGEFAGYQKNSYDQDITDLFLENMPQFSIVEVGKNGVLWSKY